MLILMILALGQGVLDRPLIAPAPTLRSEIRRGDETAQRCTISAHPLAYDAIHECIEAARATNRDAMRTGYEAFDTGLFGNQAQYFRAALSSAPPGTRFAPSSALVNLVEIEFSAARKATNLTEDQVTEALREH